MPFPPGDKQPIKPGVTWSIPDELRLPVEGGTIKKIQTQQQYKLEKVESGVATISVATYGKCRLKSRIAVASAAPEKSHERC